MNANANELNEPVTTESIGIHEECGVFGVWAPGEDVAKLTYYGLYALQHRGQEAAGIAVADHSKIVVFKDLGLVSQVFDEPTLSSMHGHIGLGHCRYSTAGSTLWENAQPIFSTITNNSVIALGHNGTLVNTVQLHGIARESGIKRAEKANSDSNLITNLIAHFASQTSMEQAAMTVLSMLSGAFCLIFMDEHTLYAARDTSGFHPLALGRLEHGGWVVASETAALDIVGANFIRDIKPGEFIAIGEDGVRSQFFARADKKSCIFEYVYLARPDSILEGRLVHQTRVNIGRQLAREYPVEADLVIPVPESGTPAAVGFAAESGIPYGQGLMKNAYIGRTFIQPSQTIRQQGIRLKLNPLREVIENKRIVVVDDSIVRGNTQRQLVKLLKDAGAAQVHVRIASSPVRWPCFYGFDFPTRTELIANISGSDDEDIIVESVRQAIDADSLGYVSLSGMVNATSKKRSSLCRACFDGIYPVEVSDNHQYAQLPIVPIESVS